MNSKPSSQLTEDDRPDVGYLCFHHMSPVLRWSKGNTLLLLKLCVLSPRDGDQLTLGRGVANHPNEHLWQWHICPEGISSEVRSSQRLYDLRISRISDIAMLPLILPNQHVLELNGMPHVTEAEDNSAMLHVPSQPCISHVSKTS